jgi:two-component system, cell cycle response regulator DivK
MKQPTVLNVEDNAYNRKIVRQLLARTSYRLVETVDGEAGLAAAFEQRPDLILMDVQLPKMSGLDATRILRADERTKDIPIIIITSFAMSGDRERATAAGASGYLAKPYSPRELLAMLRQFLPEEAS